MTQDKFLDAYDKLSDKATLIVRNKNADYSKTADAFANFRLVEKLGITDTASGVLVRMCDKFSRIANLLKQSGKVADESIQDTLIDLANYSLILAVYLENKEGYG